MPHCHSPAAQERRRLRAAARGFLVSKEDKEYEHVSVRRSVAGRVRAISRSVELHQEHNLRAGHPSHFARDASRAAGLPLAEARSALSCHRRANQAKHQWPRCSADSASPRSASRPSSPAGTAGCVSSSRPSLPARDVKCSAPTYQRNPTVREAGVQCDLPPPVTPSVEVDGHAYWAFQVNALWQSLVETQNRTIAHVCGLLEGTVPGHRKMRQLEQSVKSLAASLSATVAAQVREQSFALLTEHFDSRFNIVHEFVDKAAAKLGESHDAMFREFSREVGQSIGALERKIASASSSPGLSECFALGDEVVLFGLKSEGLNGARAHVIELPGDGCDRVGVALDNGYRKIKVRKLNLRRPAAATSPSPVAPCSPFGHGSAERSAARTFQHEKECRPSDAEMARRVAAVSWD